MGGATTFGVVYATGSKMIRRIIVPDNDAQLQSGFAGQGETLLVAPVGPHDVAACSVIVHSATGVVPPDPTCAVVDKTNTVIGMVSADPAIDALPGVTLVSAYSPQIAPGCAYDPATGLFTAPSVTISAGTDPLGNPVLQQMIPATVIQKSVAVQGPAV